MKRIAVSLGSLSLVLMQNASAEPSEALAADATETTQIELIEDSLNQELSDNSDSIFEELEDDLVTLEQEFDDDLEFDDPQEDSLAVGEAELKVQPELSVESSAAVNNDADPILADNLLESAHIPLSEEQAMENKTIETPSPVALVSQENVKPVAFAEESTDSIADEMDELNELEQNSAAADERQVEIKATDDILSQQSETENTGSQINSTTKTLNVAAHKPIEVSVSQIFSGSPTIYLILLALSVVAVTLWLLNLVTLKKFAFTNYFLMKNIRNKLMSNQYDEAIAICKSDNSFFAKMMLSAVSSRKHGLQFMLESMKSEGKRASVGFWQRLSLIHDIAIIAPLIGLLGTVLGMLYAFYDLNRSIESISTLFDGLGVSVGTTVSGIFVAILAMVLHSISKYRLVKSLTFVENEAVALAHLIDNKQNQ